MHYKTIKLNIIIPLNIHNFHFCYAREKFDIANLREFFLLHFSNFAPPHPKNGSTPLFSPPPPPHFKKASYALADVDDLFIYLFIHFNIFNQGSPLSNMLFSRGALEYMVKTFKYTNIQIQTD